MEQKTRGRVVSHQKTRGRVLARQSRRLHSSLLGHRVLGGHPVLPATNNSQPIEPVVAVPQPSEEELRRQAELEKDLQLARDIQQGMLLAAVPYLKGWEFSATSLPARDLGGDLYDFIPLPSGNQAIMIGDVSGKGLQAALRMAVTRTLFRYEARNGDESPPMALAAVNRGVCSDIPQGMVTMLYAVLDPLQGKMRIANAGHTYPLHFNVTVQEYEMPGVPLGVDPDIDYDEETISISPGDSLFLYTDGVNEAIDPSDEEFGFERLRALLEANSQIKPRALMRKILNEIRAWTAGGPQTDDITMVVLRRRFTKLSDELRVVINDVLGVRATELWPEIEALLDCNPEVATVDDWTDVLPSLSKMTKSRLSRGLSRELNQQLRLTIEEY